MTDIEKKAHALLNEVAKEMSLARYHALDLDLPGHRALCRAIEQHEAFRKEVSDAVEGFWNYCRTTNTPFPADLDRFIIAKPDPLVEAIKDCELATLDGIEEGVAYDLRAAIEKRGGKIVWGEG